MIYPVLYSSKYMKSIAYRGPVSWNELKPEMRCLVNNLAFVRVIKSHLYWHDSPVVCRNDIVRRVTCKLACLYLSFICFLVNNRILERLSSLTLLYSFRHPSKY